MKASNELIQALIKFEGMRLRAYLCPAGVWTIGVGHTRGVKPGQMITREQAHTLLRGDLVYFEQGIATLLPPALLTQGRFDALVSFAFNLGLGALERSTLLAKIRAQAPEAEIRAQFARWVYAGGKRLSGLVKRRKWEADRYFA